MSRIFISHSSVNNALALAIGRWLADNGWDDCFVDLGPVKEPLLAQTLATAENGGIKAIDIRQRALAVAANR